ncbi:metalloregulator ArsR/SmtB family transcription factor [Methanosarcina sp.]|jgi:DNA-binding transcriptional ArsR family regulator|uniref:ArsR/SmtB family transcription factor n=1 Tax=Methanosarcina sp. TaxID=2213 RepID=UPI0029892CF9|nr:metalloregulator ArsR/SmtB family transcription factor [Methanosarcina sp.]MDW5549332.1 metalloregulator ArsR/SmtB family transcription factor [Methanosarcina sp.]MDW5553477.1 metalloregulator ArsR/SmtB family transcription factor [Methanosarcina sp.]MDW5559801.1 metalloregulator ArsR/SmtB family transcription factor [Methanosarcina sp.]
MVELDKCETNCIHDEAVQAVRQALFGDDVATSLAELFKALGDPTRVKILFSLMTRELCVCDLTAVIGISESAVSHQLKILRTLRLVKFRREGKVLYYSLDDDHIEKLFAQGLEHVTE